jgi:hypothetical protein
MDGNTGEMPPDRAPRLAPTNPGVLISAQSGQLSVLQHRSERRAPRIGVGNLPKTAVAGPNYLGPDMGPI